MYISNHIGKKIRKIREERNLSQARFGYKIGVSGKTISSYETGRSVPSLNVLMKISDVYGVTILHTPDALKAELVSQIKAIKDSIHEIETGLSL